MDDFNTEAKKGTSLLRSPHFKSLMASAIPSIVMRPVYQPLEILKIRFQLQHKNLTHELHFKSIEKGEAYKSMFHAIQVIHAEEGWRGIFRGLGYAQFANTLSSVVQFAVYRKVRRELHNTSLGNSKQWCDFLAGFVTGAATAVLMNPFDCVRTHLLARENVTTNGVFTIARNVYKDGGVASFYNGAFAALLHSGTLNGIRFMFYNIGCNYAMKSEGVTSHKNLPPLTLFVSGFGAGLAANLFAYPIEFLKRRLMQDKAHLQHSKAIGDVNLNTKDFCKAFISCLSTVARTEGFLAFYKGFVPNAMKSIIATMIQLSCYDMIYNAIEDWFS